MKGAPPVRKVPGENWGPKGIQEIQVDLKDLEEPRGQPGLKVPLETAVKRVTPARKVPRESRVNPESKGRRGQSVLRDSKENRENQERRE